MKTRSLRIAALILAGVAALGMFMAAEYWLGGNRILLRSPRRIERDSVRSSITTTP